MPETTPPDELKRDRAGSSPSTMESPSDGSLLRRFRSGDDDAATELYVRYANRLLTLSRAQTGVALRSRFDPEDVVQSVFRTFFRRASEGLYDVPPGEQLWQLLLVLALNKVRALGAFHRAQRRDVTATVMPERGLADIAGPTNDATALQILEIVVADLLKELPAIQRQIVELRIQGHDIAAIAVECRRSKRTVERVLHRFRKRLAEMIDEPPNHDHTSH